MSPITIFAPGTAVEIGLVSDPIPAAVVSATIHATGTVYCVCWWDGRNRQQQNLDDFEVRPLAGTRRVNVGFAAACNGR